MTIEISRFERSDHDTWNSYVEQSPQAGPFQRAEALSVMADYTDTTLHRYVGSKGQETVGIFPVFEVRRGPVVAAFSPPPRLMVPYLGPAMLNQSKLKQRKAERRHNRFIEACLERIEADVSPAYTRIKTDPGYDDLRAFQWNDFEVEPRYTYIVDLTSGPDELLDRFSSDARRNIRDGQGVEFEIEVGRHTAVRAIVDQMRRRYEIQDRPYGVSQAYAVDLYEALPEGTVRPYVYPVAGEFAGGILAVADDEAVYRWQGGVRPDVDVDIAINDHLDWRIMRDAMEDGLAEYDLVGAGTPRINRYKAKFNPELRTSHSVERGTWPVTAFVDLYRRLA